MHRFLRHDYQHRLVVILGLISIGGGLLNGCSHIMERSDRSSSSESVTLPSSEVGSESASLAPFPGEAPEKTDEGSEILAEAGQRLSTLEPLDPDGQGLPPGRLPLTIVPSTTEAGRQGQVLSGRRDPFAPLPTTPVLVQRRPSLPVISGTSSNVAPSPATGSATDLASPTIALPPSPHPVEPVPLAPRQTLTTPPLPPSATPPQTIAVTPLPEPTLGNSHGTLQSPTGNSSPLTTLTAPASPTLEFSGVVQVGDQINIIVQEPGRASSRYIQVGDRIANGQFIVKAVDFNRGPTPAVILDQAGTEIVHWVGSPAIVGAGI